MQAWTPPGPPVNQLVHQHDAPLQARVHPFEEMYQSSPQAAVLKLANPPLQPAGEPEAMQVVRSADKRQVMGAS
ncbi:MAG: hypothetical protein ABUL62_13600 [Myxococcales bacterium]